MSCDYGNRFNLDLFRRMEMDLNALERFEALECMRALLRKWEGHFLPSMLRRNERRSACNCLEMMIVRLSDIQTSLSKTFQIETVMMRNTLNVVKEFEPCKIAYQKLSDSLQGIISHLHASVAILSACSTNPDTFYVDQKYVKLRNGQSKRRGKCRVCDKEGCRSANPPTPERDGLR